MIKFKTKIKSFSVPISWLDLTFAQYSNLVALDSTIEQVKLLTGLNEVELAMIDVEPIVHAISFLNEPIDDIEPSNYINDSTLLPDDIGEESFEKKIMVVDAIKEGNIIEAIRIYSGVDVSNHSCYDVFGNFNFITKQVEAILLKESEMLSSTITFEQQQAGIDAFDILGAFNIIDKIARDYSYTHAEVEQLSYNLVFLILLKSNITSKFEEKYNKIINDRSKSNR